MSPPMCWRPICAPVWSSVPSPRVRRRHGIWRAVSSSGHKAAAAAALAVLLALLTGITATTLMYLRTQRALEHSQQVSRFLKETLAQAQASNALGRDSTMMREILDKTAERIGPELQHQPEVQAELRSIIAQTYLDLGRYDLAVEQSAAALALQRSVSGHDREALADALYLHAHHLQEGGEPKLAEERMRETIAMRQRLHGDDDSRTLQARIELAWILMQNGRAREGEASAWLELEAWRKNPDDPLLQRAPSTLAAIMHHLKRHEESLSLFLEQLEMLRRRYGPEHPGIAVCLSNVGMQHCRMERFAGAEPYFKESLRQETLFYGKDRMPNGWYVLRGLMRVEGARGNHAEQLHYAREAMSEVKKFHPPGHQHYGWTADDLTKVLMENAERTARTDPPRSLTFLDELAASKDLETSVKPHAA